MLIEELKKSIKIVLNRLECSLEEKNVFEDMQGLYLKEKTDKLKKISYIKNALEEIKSLEELMSNKEFYDEAKEELQNLYEKIIKNISLYNLPEKFLANKFFFEIKSGVGGSDAEDWVKILLRIYTKFFEKNNYVSDILDISSGSHGIKQVCLSVEGPMYKLVGEIGIHRLVRISPFNANKKRHTSFASVDIYPYMENKNIQINEKDKNSNI